MLLVLVIAVGAAWLAAPHVQRLDGGVTMQTLKPGKGPSPTGSDIALINYKGMLSNGKVFDQGQQVPMPVTGVVPGFSTALQAMQAGGSYRVHIPADKGYGSEEKRNQSGEVVIPANSDLTFDVDLLEFRSQQEIMQMMQQQQLQQQLQGGAGGAPGGAPPGAGQ